MPVQAGKIVLFGSGETSPTGRAIHRKVFLSLGKKKHRVAILETPAGFQPNSEFVADEIARMFRESLAEFIEDVSIIPARKRGTACSPDNAELLKPLESSDVIFLGPGSPTYALKQLRDSLAWKLIVNRWREGAILSLASAAILAIGKRTLPVYEIYKVGTDLFWEPGLNLLAEIGLPITIVSHWNNQEGGKDLDTSRCFMGKKRFEQLRRLLPDDEVFLGIDEHTAVIINPNFHSFSVEGKGVATLLVGEKEQQFFPGVSYDVQSILTATVIGATEAPVEKEIEKEKVLPLDISALPSDIQSLIRQREISKNTGDFVTSDQLRIKLQHQGYEARDTENGQLIFPRHSGLGTFDVPRSGIYVK